MKVYKPYILFIIFFIFLTSCRTMQLNQDANVLGRNAYETSVGGGLGIEGNLVNGNTVLGGANVNVEVQQRFGIDDKIEIQIKGHSDLTMGGLQDQGFMFYNHNVVTLGLKVDLLGIQTHGFAFIPFIGLTNSINNTRTKGVRYNPNVNLNVSFDPNVGFALLGSKEYYHRNLYFGGIVNISPNIAGIATGLESQSTFDLDFSFNIGWERLAYKVIYRNEFSIFTGFVFNFVDYSEYTYNEGKNQVDANNLRFVPNLLIFNFGLSYHFSAAFRR